MTGPLAVAGPIASPASPREARVDRFLARVAALTPRQWGELDAIGQQLEDGDPIAWWRNARRAAAFAGRIPALEDVLSVVGFVAAGVGELQRAVRGRRATAPRLTRLTRLPPLPAGASGESRQVHARLETLWDVASAQPGGPGPAIHGLTFALLALWLRDRLPDDGFARVYELVEPVIPAASL